MTSSDQQNDITSYEAATSAEPKLCANNCGFFGNPTTMGLCSKCFKATVQPNYTPARNDMSFCSSREPNEISALTVAAPVAPAANKAAATRCNACRRKVGLLGFVCKCGDTFCGAHRYPEEHQCGFDFKGLGRDAIKVANPTIKADKITRF